MLVKKQDHSQKDKYGILLSGRNTQLRELLKGRTIGNIQLSRRVVEDYRGSQYTKVKSMFPSFGK